MRWRPGLEAPNHIQCRMLRRNAESELTSTSHAEKLRLALNAGNKRNDKARLESLRGHRMVFIFDELMTGEHPCQELQTLPGPADREHFRKACLLPALAASVIAPTLPDKPNSRLQSEIAPAGC